jgi:hypothetical protein
VYVLLRPLSIPRCLYSSRSLPSCQNALEPSLLIATEPPNVSSATALGKAKPKNARANCRCSIFHYNTDVNKGAEQNKKVISWKVACNVSNIRTDILSRCNTSHNVRSIVLYTQSWLILVALCSDSSRIRNASQDSTLSLLAQMLESIPFLPKSPGPYFIRCKS